MEHHPHTCMGKPSGKEAMISDNFRQLVLDSTLTAESMSIAGEQANEMVRNCNVKPLVRESLWRGEEAWGFAVLMFCFGSVFGGTLALVLRRWLE